MTPVPNRFRPRSWLARLTLASAAVAACLALLPGPSAAPAQQPLTNVVREVNKKLVKLYGAGGFKGLPSYGTGILISPDGWILTVNSHILNTADLRIHLYDGSVYLGNVVYKEPAFDIALVQIDEREKVDKLPYFDFAKAAAAPVAQPGEWVLAFSNQFNIATRDEPMSVQRGVIAAHTALHGRKGVFRAPFEGEVYFSDAIMNNPGAAGGALTNARGELLGIIGRELKNTLSDTWINYAIPAQAKVEAIPEGKDKAVTVTLADFVRQGMARKYKAINVVGKDKKEGGGYTGIVLVPNAVSVTPPYVEEVIPGSPAAKAGLRPDDLIVYIEGELVPSVRQYREIMRFAARPNEELTIDVPRGNKRLSSRLKVGARPTAGK
jgi:S1-C subfamily serine protease